MKETKALFIIIMGLLIIALFGSLAINKEKEMYKTTTTEVKCYDKRSNEIENQTCKQKLTPRIYDLIMILTGITMITIGITKTERRKPTRKKEWEI